MTEPCDEITHPQRGTGRGIIKFPFTFPSFPDLEEAFRMIVLAINRLKGAQVPIGDIPPIVADPIVNLPLLPITNAGLTGQSIAEAKKTDADKENEIVSVLNSLFEPYGLETPFWRMKLGAPEGG